MSLSIRFVCPLMALTCVFAVARAQQPIEGVQGDRFLDAKELKGDEKNTFAKLRDGNIEYEKAHKPLLEKAAQWYVYRITSPVYQRKTLPDSTDRQTVYDIVNDCNRQIYDRSKLSNKEATRDKQLAFLKEYTEEVGKAVDDVLKNPMPIARVNAGRILAHMGKTGVEETGDRMVKVLQDKDQLDAVKLYALRGLKDLFQTINSNPDPVVQRKFNGSVRQGKYVQAVVEFMHRQPTNVKGMSPEEVEAFRYVRREAVRALAQLRQPVVISSKKKVFAQPALELLRVVAKEGFTPEPSLSERTEAALGVLQMQTKLSPGYQAEYAGPVLGQFLMDFTLEFDNDRKNPPGPNRLEPWKVLSVRFQQGFEIWKAEANTPYAASITNQSLTVLRAIERDQVASIQNLRATLQTSKPKTTSLYKGDDKAVVEPPPAAN
jgi:hypothetical protein